MSLSPGSQLVCSLLFAICLMFGLWSVQLRTRDAGIVDVGWASSLGLLAIFYAATDDSSASARPWLVGLIAAIWQFICCETGYWESPKMGAIRSSDRDSAHGHPSFSWASSRFRHCSPGCFLSPSGWHSIDLGHLTGGIFADCRCGSSLLSGNHWQTHSWHSIVAIP